MSVLSVVILFNDAIIDRTGDVRSALSVRFVVELIENIVHVTASETKTAVNNAEKEAYFGFSALLVHLVDLTEQTLVIHSEDTSYKIANLVDNLFHI